MRQQAAGQGGTRRPSASASPLPALAFFTPSLSGELVFLPIRLEFVTMHVLKYLRLSPELKPTSHVCTPMCPLQSSLRPEFTPCCSWSGVDFPVNASDLFPIMNCSLNLCLLILILFPLGKEFSLTIELFKEICLWTHCFQVLCITLSDNSNLKRFVKSISKVSWTQWNREKAELWKIKKISLIKRNEVDTGENLGEPWECYKWEKSNMEVHKL